jgi:dihydropyrimidinase
MYGLNPRKGSISIGGDADVCIWDPKKEVTIRDEDVHDQSGYTPYVGRRIQGWPVTVLRRGDVLVENGKLSSAAKPGSGAFLARAAGPAAKPTGRPTLEFDLARNFGTKLY